MVSQDIYLLLGTVILTHRIIVKASIWLACKIRYRVIDSVKMSRYNFLAKDLVRAKVGRFLSINIYISETQL